jgi:hypothetical protein
MRPAHEKGQTNVPAPERELDFCCVTYITLGALGAFHQGAGSNLLSSIASSTVAVMMAIKEIISIIV